MSATYLDIALETLMFNGDKHDSELAEKAAAELAALREKESELRFYHGVVLGDGDHDKNMLARDAEVFLRCFRLLGLDISGTDIQEIPDAIERLKSKGGE